MQLTDAHIKRNGKYESNPYITGEVDESDINPVSRDEIDGQQDQISNPEHWGAPFVIKHKKGSVSDKYYFFLKNKNQLNHLYVCRSIASRSERTSPSGLSTTRRPSPASFSWTSLVFVPMASLLIGLPSTRRRPALLSKFWRIRKLNITLTYSQNAVVNNY